MQSHKENQNQQCIDRIKQVVNIRHKRINYLNGIISTNKKKFKTIENNFTSHQLKLQKELDYCEKQLKLCKDRLNKLLNKNIEDQVRFNDYFYHTP